jgi:dTDP-glucose 4,6-dehydratase
VKLVVITGCLGLIGSHVTKRCLEEGWQVLGVDKCSYAANKSLIKKFEKNKNFSFIKKDIATLEYLPDCDYVINLAAESHVGNSIVDSGDFLHSNINGVKNLLDLIRNKQKNVFNQPVLLHFSTDEVYGDIIRGEHLETDNLNPSNPYSASKAAADMLINAWARTYDINYIIVRPTNNYGINQYPEKLIPISVKALQLGKKIKLHNKGEPIRNWLHAEDTAEAIITIIKSNKINEIYNISGNLEQKNKITVQKIINAYFGEEVPLENFVDLSHCREGQDVRYSLNDNKLKLLGWKPTKNFDKEIKTIVSFYKNNFRW